MKQIFLTITIILACIAMPAMAQVKQNKMIQNGVTMKNGELWTVKDGKTTKMAMETTLKDGSRVMTNGNVITPDGSTRMLRNDESITNDGVWTDKAGNNITNRPMEEMQHKNMDDKELKDMEMKK